MYLNVFLRVQSYEKKRKWEKFSIFALQKNFKRAMESVVLICFVAYTVLLFAVMWLSSRKSSGNDAFSVGSASRRGRWWRTA